MTNDFCINYLKCGNYAMDGSNFCRECRDEAMKAYLQKNPDHIDKHQENAKQWQHRHGKQQVTK